MCEIANVNLFIRHMLEDMLRDFFSQENGSRALPTFQQDPSVEEPEYVFRGGSHYRPHHPHFNLAQFSAHSGSHSGSATTGSIPNDPDLSASTTVSIPRASPASLVHPAASANATPTVSTIATAPTGAAAKSSGLHQAAAMRIGGAGTVDALKNMSGQVGRDLFALDFLDHRGNGNSDIGNPDWLLNPYSAWKKENPDRKLILSVPMLQESERGQLAQGASGAFDDRFRSLAQKLQASGLGDSVIRLGWEANGDWFPWSAQSDPAAYKAYFQRIVTLMREAAPGLKFDFTINQGQTTGGKTNLENIYPGDEYVDIIGMDAYDGFASNDPSQQNRWQTIYNGTNGLAYLAQFASDHRKQVSIPEWGISTKAANSDNAYYIDQMAAFMSGVDLAYQSYFDSSDGGVGTTLEQNSNAFAAYKRNFGGATV